MPNTTKEEADTLTDTENKPQEAGERQLPEKEHETLPESIAGIAAVFVSGLFILTFIIQQFEIPSSSMEKTLLIGDHVFVDRLTPTGKGAFPGFLMPYRDIHRGNIAVFVSPEQPGLYLVKRIVGVPGDHIHLENGVLYLNGVRQAQPFVIHNRYEPARDDFPAYGPAGSSAVEDWPQTLRQHLQGRDLVIPPDSYFAMGDNRDVSFDSRYWGFVPRNNILGSPLFIAWSLNQTEADFPQNASVPERVGSFFRTAIHFFGLTRWDRVMRLVH
ncbi:MAG TPA: signal peptidase I [Terriglobales bacterium]